jgi:hypothetical protein
VAMAMPHLEDPLVSSDTHTSHIRISAEQNSPYTSSRQQDGSGGDALAILLPFLFVLSTLLFVMILFLVCVLLLRRRRGILLRDNDGPVDVSRDDVFNDADGGLAGVEERWLDSLGEDVKRGYRQAKCTYCRLFTLQKWVFAKSKSLTENSSILQYTKHNIHQIQ